MDEEGPVLVGREAVCSVPGYCRGPESVLYSCGSRLEAQLGRVASCTFRKEPVSKGTTKIAYARRTPDARRNCGAGPRLNVADAMLLAKEGR